MDIAKLLDLPDEANGKGPKLLADWAVICRYRIRRSRTKTQSWAKAAALAFVGPTKVE
jgi:hypothetical protein